MNTKKLKVISFFLIFNLILFPISFSTAETQQIPISEGDTIEGQARNIKDISYINLIISVRFI